MERGLSVVIEPCLAFYESRSLEARTDPGYDTISRIERFKGWPSGPVSKVGVEPGPQHSPSGRETGTGSGCTQPVPVPLSQARWAKD
jgi:hypothetical protein